MKKRLINCSICLLLVVCVCFGAVYYTRNSGDVVESSSVERENDSTDVLILSSGVPLAGTTETDLSNEIFLEINKYRVANGLKELTWSPDLVTCADVRAEEITRLWSHTRPDGSSWYTVNDSIMYGENLAKGSSKASDIVTAWKNSPSHNANLLKSNFKYVGISVYNDSYIACEFCY